VSGQSQTPLATATPGRRPLALKKQSSPARPPGPGFHLAFNAATVAAVNAFHSEALRAGGTDNGGPGLRPHYGADYDAAFVIDPDAHPIEAVFRRKCLSAGTLGRDLRRVEAGHAVGRVEPDPDEMAEQLG
jgi:catechol 2,3-dioxygenase-like lactoylglutathione lyase family enzyme